MRKLVLASTSPYRRELLERLRLPFDIAAPQADETALPGETSSELVLRLAEAKARAVADAYPNAVIIGSDQVAACEGRILGKPGNHAIAAEQLTFLSGKEVVFQTGLCVLNTATDDAQTELVPYTVHFRALDEATIERYLKREPAYNCAGSFKSEGYGIVLCQRWEGEDPSALIGLPLMRLTSMLSQVGFVIP